MFKVVMAYRLLDFLSSLHLLLPSNLGHSTCDSDALGLAAPDPKAAALALLSPLPLSHTQQAEPLSESRGGRVGMGQRELIQWEHAEKEHGGMSVTG